MSLVLRDFPLDISENESRLPELVANSLGVAQEELLDFCILRRSIDARKKNRIRRIYTLRFSCPDEDSLLKNDALRLEKTQVPEDIISTKISSGSHVMVVGMGPAGLFAAKWLVEAGAKVTLIDRGQPIEQRVDDVEKFWSSAIFNPGSNVQFGEGGAGTFSDGKLTTRLNHPLRYHVLQTLVALGAPQDILIDARPHVGTDRLRKVIIGFRKYLNRMGVDIRFGACLTDLEENNGCIQGGILNERELISCDAILLAPGHSARDTYRMLERRGVRLSAKGFAVGVRVEHPAELISRIQYGRFADQLPVADYALRYNDKQTGRGIYSFCMCPGGEVINAASEQDGLVVNGMSRLCRGSGYSNSALVVTVSPEDWGSPVMGGVIFQQKLERQAFQSAGADFMAPAQNLMAFAGSGSGPVKSTCRPGVVETELREVLPDFVYHGLQQGLPHFEKKMNGFLTSEAVVVGVETRTSAPLRIMRNESGESVSHQGLFPAGEGAGYAGGIMSAAFDGIRAAENILQSLSVQETV
jgi:uncharacterized FAD-dependent dehydrogenase